MRVINKSAEAFVGTYCQTVLQRLLALGPPNDNPCQQYKRHTHGRYSHNYSTIRKSSARIFRYHKQPTVQLFDAHKKGICFGFVSKAEAISFLNSKTSLVKHTIDINTPRDCANHLWIFKHFSHILFLYCFVTCFLMLSGIHPSHFVNTANFLLT